MPNKNTINKPNMSYIRGNIKIEFSNSVIHPHDQFGFVKDEKSITRHSYVLSGYIKINDKWERTFETTVFNYPNINRLRNALKCFAEKEKQLENYQTVNKGNHTEYSFTEKILDMGSDNYTISHIVETIEDNVIKSYYDIAFGCSTTKCSLKKEFLVLHGLSEEEFSTLYKYIEDFYEETIKETNNKIRKSAKEKIQSWKISENRLIHFSDSGKQINSINTVGDKVEISVLRGDLDSNDFYSDCYEDAFIKRIEDNSITLIGGFTESYATGDITHIEEIELPINRLLQISHTVPYEKVRYKEKEIAMDFLELLSEEEKEEFKDKSVNRLYDKWKEAILERTHMLRDEHRLPFRKKDMGNHENVYASIKQIIKIIKKSI